MTRKLSFFLALLVALLASAAPAGFAQELPSAWEEISSQVINPTTSTALTVPANAQWAQVSIRTAGVHVSADATAATTSDLYYAPNVYTTPPDRALLVSLRFLDSSDGASTVYVRYFRKRR